MIKIKENEQNKLYIKIKAKAVTDVNKLSGLKRLKKQVSLGKKVENDGEDPYIYTGGVILRGTCRRRKL